MKLLLMAYLCALSCGVHGKEPACQCRRLRDTGSIPGLGRSPGEGLGRPLQYSCLENPMNRGAWMGGGALQSRGSQRVRHDRSDLASTHHLRDGGRNQRSSDLRVSLFSGAFPVVKSSLTLQEVFPFLFRS